MLMHQGSVTVCSGKHQAIQKLACCKCNCAVQNFH
jgi:hypothetical protein